MVGTLRLPERRGDRTHRVVFDQTGQFRETTRGLRARCFCGGPCIYPFFFDSKKIVFGCFSLVAILGNLEHLSYVGCSLRHIAEE